MGTLSIWHFVIFFAVLLIVAVSVVVILGVMKSSRSRQQQPPPTAPQPGWYPDNLNPAQMRWFDGYQWTDQVQQR